MFFRIIALLIILVLPIGLIAKNVSFNRDIRPILSSKCYFCHGPDAAEIKGKLQLHTLELATSDRGGEGAAIVPGTVGNFGSSLVLGLRVPSNSCTGVSSTADEPLGSHTIVSDAFMCDESLLRSVEGESHQLAANVVEPNHLSCMCRIWSHPIRLL